MTLAEVPDDRIIAAHDDIFDRMEFLKAHTDGSVEGPTVPVLESRTNLLSAPEVESLKLLERVRRLASPDYRPTVSLLVLLAYLEGVPFDEAAQLLRTSPKQLVRWMRGQHTVPVKKSKEVELLADVLRHLHRVLEPWATREWLHTPIPALGGLTPFVAVRRRRLRDLQTVARSYTEPSIFT